MSEFNQEEWSILSTQLRLTTAACRDPHYAIDASALLDPRACQELLDHLSPILQSSSRAITASLLAKRVAFLATASSLYAMSIFNKGLDFSIDNCFVEYGHQDGLWQSRMVLDNCAISEPDGNGRPAWREQVVERLFAGNLAKFWAVLCQVSGLAPRIVWENTAVRIYSLYERRMKTIACPQRRQQAQDDFTYLVRDAPPHVFGISENPLSRYFFEHTPIQGTQEHVRFRKTCCLYYLTCNKEEYCSTCPLIRP